MTKETGDGPEQVEEHRGLRALSMLKLTDIANADFTTANGTSFKGRDFLDHCGPEAEMGVAGLEALGPHDPDFHEMAEEIGKHVRAHLEGQGKG